MGKSLTFWHIILSVLGILLLSGPALLAQKEGIHDRIFLKTGSRANGEILEIGEEFIRFKTLKSDLIINYPIAMVRSYQLGIIPCSKKDPQFIPRKEKYYLGIRLGLMSTGGESFRQEAGPWLFEASAGFQFTRGFGLGIMAGKHVFDIGEHWRELYPLAIEVKGYFSDHSLSPFYRFNLGYEFAKYFVDKKELGPGGYAQGGIFAKGSLGLSWALSNHFLFSSELGIHLGKASFPERFWWNVPNQNEYTLKRVFLNFGIQFFINSKLK